MIAMLWGPEGTCKTTIGLSFPKPLFFMELDIGGFERAIWRVQEQQPDIRVLEVPAGFDITTIDWDEWDIVSKPYPLPVQIEKLVGAQKSNITVKFPKRIVGYKEIWEALVTDFVYVCQTPAVKSMQPDSATKMWEICHRSHLQDKQEIQLAQGVKETDNRFRERLQPVEFPNEKMHGLIYTAKSFGKHLILTHYPTDEYADKITEKGKESYKTGKIIPDGFKHTKQDATVIIWTYLDGNMPRAKIGDKCALPGIGTQGIGLELPDNSYEGLMQIGKMLRGED